MSTGITFMRVERTTSGANQLGAEANRVEFVLSDSQGLYGLLPVVQAKEARSRLSGTVSIEIPTDQAGEADMVAKARDVLHAALTRLAAAAKP